jgi:hypothetical protein
MQNGSPNIYAIAASVLLIGVVLFFRMRKMAAKRPLNPGRLWIMPAIFTGVAALTLSEQPLHGIEWLWAVVAFALGVVAGWQRGRLMKIWVDPETDTLMSQGSGWAIAFLVALIALRTLLRTGLQYEASTWAISPALIGNAFVIFAVGLFGTQRSEMFVRASRLRKAHVESKAGVV